MSAAKLPVDEIGRSWRRGGRPGKNSVDIEIDAVAENVHDVEVVFGVAALDAVDGDEGRRGVVLGEDNLVGGLTAPEHYGGIAVSKVEEDAGRFGSKLRDGGDGGVAVRGEDAGNRAVGSAGGGVEGIALPRFDEGRGSPGHCQRPGAGVGETLSVERQPKRRKEIGRVSTDRTRFPLPYELASLGRSRMLVSEGRLQSVGKDIVVRIAQFPPLADALVASVRHHRRAAGNGECGSGRKPGKIAVRGRRRTDIAGRTGDDERVVGQIDRITGDKGAGAAIREKRPGHSVVEPGLAVGILHNGHKVAHKRLAIVDLAGVEPHAGV